MHGQEITIILTTHYLEEADFLCDRIAIIDFGKIVALGTADDLKKAINGDIIRLESSNNKLLSEKLAKIPMNSMKEVGGFLNLDVDNGKKTIPKLVLLAAKNKITTERITKFKESLRILQNLSVPISCLITAMEIIPPPIAAVK